MSARRWKEARRSRAAERDASGGGAPRAVKDAARGRSGLAVTLAALAVVVLGGGADLLACPACFGAEETTLIDGTRLGILVMLGITFAVQGAFAGFFFYLRRRAKQYAEYEIDTEWSELQRASRTS